MNILRSILVAIAVGSVQIGVSQSSGTWGVTRENAGFGLPNNRNMPGFYGQYFVAPFSFRINALTLRNYGNYPIDGVYIHGWNSDETKPDLATTYSSCLVGRKFNGKIIIDSHTDPQCFNDSRWDLTQGREYFLKIDVASNSGGFGARTCSDCETPNQMFCCLDQVDRVKCYNNVDLYFIFNYTTYLTTSPTTLNPTTHPSMNPSSKPTTSPSSQPSQNPTTSTTANPTSSPSTKTSDPTAVPSSLPTVRPTSSPSQSLMSTTYMNTTATEKSPNTTVDRTKRENAGNTAATTANASSTSDPTIIAAIVGGVLGCMCFALMIVFICREKTKWKDSDDDFEKRSSRIPHLPIIPTPGLFKDTSKSYSKRNMQQLVNSVSISLEEANQGLTSNNVVPEEAVEMEGARETADMAGSHVDDGETALPGEMNRESTLGDSQFGEGMGVQAIATVSNWTEKDVHEFVCNGVGKGQAWKKIADILLTNGIDGAVLLILSVDDLVAMEVSRVHGLTLIAARDKRVAGEGEGC